MSVITSYVMKTESNIVETLEKAGILSRGKSFEVPKYKFDEKGIGHPDGKRTRYTATINLAKLWPEDWQLCLKDICERGVTAYGSDIDIKQFALSDYIRHVMDKPVIPEDRTFSHYGDKNGVQGYYTRDKQGTPGTAEFVPFDDDTLAEITAGAKELEQMWKPGEGSGIRRDYMDKEKARMPIYHVEFDEDGKCISYCRNYAHGLDDLAPNYIAHFLPGVQIHLTICTECMCDYDGYSENGIYGENKAPSRKEQEEALYGVAE